MPRSARSLSATAVTVLTMIGDRHSYEQILAAHPTLTYRDIFDAAREALAVAGDGDGHDDRLVAIRAVHPRAYEPWTRDEDERLRAMVAGGETAAAMSVALQRQPGAIRSRMLRLGLPA